MNHYRTAAELLASSSLVAFDLDGTLVNAFDDIAAAANTMLRAMDFSEVSTHEVKKHVGRGARLLTAGLLGCSENDPLMDKAFPILFKYYQEHPSDLATVYPGVTDLLETLHRRGILLAVTSNKPHPMTVRTLEVTGLIGHFDWVQKGGDRFPTKPDPALLQYLMMEFVVNPQDCVVVGDTQYDIRFAKNAEVRSIAVTHGQCSREELESHSPDVIVDGFANLAKTIENL